MNICQRNIQYLQSSSNPVFHVRNITWCLLCVSFTRYFHQVWGVSASQLPAPGVDCSFSKGTPLDAPTFRTNHDSEATNRWGFLIERLSKEIPFDRCLTLSDVSGKGETAMVKGETATLTPRKAENGPTQQIIRGRNATLPLRLNRLGHLLLDKFGLQPGALNRFLLEWRGPWGLGAFLQSVGSCILAWVKLGPTWSNTLGKSVQICQMNSMCLTAHKALVPTIDALLALYTGCQDFGQPDRNTSIETCGHMLWEDEQSPKLEYSIIFWFWFNKTHNLLVGFQSICLLIFPHITCFSLPQITG